MTTDEDFTDIPQHAIDAARAALLEEVVPGLFYASEDGLNRLRQIIRNQALEDAANGSSALAKKWWARHCETNKHMETTREAHEDFCQLERAIRSMKKDQTNG